MNLDIKKAIPIHRRKTASGLDVIVVPRDAAPIVSMNLAYKVGSKDETLGKTGFAHLFEHLMFEGSRNVAKGDFDKYCTMAGGVNNAYTTYDWTAYTMTLPSHQLELGLWLESDRMLRFEITPHALENQQKVVYEEILQTVENQPYGSWREKLAQIAFAKDSCYSWEVHGEKEDVIDCIMDDARDFFEQYYKPSNAVLSIVGNVDPEESFELCEKYFNEAKDVTPPTRNEFKTEYLRGGVKSEFTDNVPLAASFVSFHAPGFLDDELLKGDLLAFISGIGRSSTLHSKLVYNSQIASQTGSFVDKREHTSLLTFYAIANSPETKAEQLENEIFKILESIRDEGIKPEELRRAGNQLTMGAANEIAFSSGIADLVSNLALFHDKPEMAHDALAKYKAISLDETNQFIKKVIHRENSVIVNINPA